MNIDNIKKILQEAELKLIQKRNEQITNELRDTIGKAQLSKEDLLKAISGIQINVPEIPKAEVDVKLPEMPKIEIPKIELPTINVPEPKVTVNVPEVKIPKIVIPEIKIPEIKIPKIATPKVPKPEVTVNVPKIDLPDLKWPKGKMPIEGWVNLMGVDLNNPLPVQLRDSNGNPVVMPEGGGGSSGPGRKVVQLEKPKSVKMFNVYMELGNFEYSQQLPEGTRAMTMQNREAEDIRISYEAGKVASSTAAFMTVKSGQAYYETNVELSGKTIYVASERDENTAEIIAYY